MRRCNQNAGYLQVSLCDGSNIIILGNSSKKGNKNLFHEKKSSNIYFLGFEMVLYEILLIVI